LDRGNGRYGALTPAERRRRTGRGSETPHLSTVDSEWTDMDTDGNGDDAGSADRLRGRVSGNRGVLWVVLEADRRVVVAATFVAVCAGLLAVGWAIPGAEASIRASDSVDTLFQGLLTATVTGVTLILTLNQLVLSQELGAVGDQRERMAAALDFRDVAADLDGAQFGEFEVVSAALNFDYSRKVFAAKRLRARDDPPDAVVAALDDLVETLELFGPAREHFKTLYFQRELIDLSRTILVVSVPALLVAVGMVAFVDPGAAWTSGLLVPFVAGATSVALLPFLVLLAYVVRIATVTKHTLSIGPFILHETDDAGTVAWDGESDER
jgi:hypothetical protein